MSDWHLKQAIYCLHQNGIIAYPTEAVYGLGCDPYNERAVKRLLALKHRRWQKGLILIAAHYTQLTPFLEPLTTLLQQRLHATWPGPTTWLLPAKPKVPQWLRGQSPYLAVRVTAHPIAKALCQLYGRALVSTSANRGGQLPAKTAFQVRCRLPAVDYIVPGQIGNQLRPTEIRHGLTNTVIRH